MSDTPHASDVPGHDGSVAGDRHAIVDDGSAHGHDDQGHDDDELGAFDLSAWGAGLLGVILGIAVAICFVLATATIRGG